MDESSNNNNSKQSKTKSKKEKPTGLMSPHLLKQRINPGGSQLTMESTNSRVNSSHAIAKPPVSKRGDKEQSAKGAARRSSKMKVEAPQIISSSKKVNSSNELLE